MNVFKATAQPIKTVPDDTGLEEYHVDISVSENTSDVRTRGWIIGY